MASLAFPCRTDNKKRNATVIQGPSSRNGGNVVDAATGCSQDSDVDAQSPEFKGQEWHHVPIVGGGFATGIIYNQTEPGLNYARTDVGGLYRWDSAAEQWLALTDWVGFDNEDLKGIESVATDPVDPDRLYVAAGLYTIFWSTQNGVILRSRDRGKTFEQSMLPFKFGGNMPGRSMGERLAVDPNQHDIVYYGARSGNGLWKSVDAGISWNRVESFTATGDWADKDFNDAVGVVWVIFDPTTGTPGSPTRTIYVGVADTVASIYRSDDSVPFFDETRTILSIPIQLEPETQYAMSLNSHHILGFADEDGNFLLPTSYSFRTGPKRNDG